MGKKIRTEITEADVENYRRIYTAALIVQKDGKDKYFMTPEKVDEQLAQIQNDDVLTAIEYGKDPVDEATRDSLAYRTFTLDEVNAFKNDFEAYLSEKLDWYDMLTPERVKHYSEPLTIKRIIEELRKGNNGRKFVEDLYLTHLGWTGLED